MQYHFTPEDTGASPTVSGLRTGHSGYLAPQAASVQVYPPVMQGPYFPGQQNFVPSAGGPTQYPVAYAPPPGQYPVPGAMPVSASQDPPPTMIGGYLISEVTFSQPPNHVSFPQTYNPPTIEIIPSAPPLDATLGRPPPYEEIAIDDKTNNTSLS